jgi:hypothetical protein
MVQRLVEMKLSREDENQLTDYDWPNIGDEDFQDIDGNHEFGQENHEDYVEWFESRGREPAYKTFGYFHDGTSYSIEDMPQEVWGLIMNAKHGE